MKTKIATSVLYFLLLNSLAIAEVSKGEEYTAYHYTFNQEKVTVTLSVMYETTDSCNHFGLVGRFRRIEDGGPNIPLSHDLLADFGVIGTRIACPPSTTVRRIFLQSEPFEVSSPRPLNGRIFVPKGMTIQFSAHN